MAGGPHGPRIPEGGAFVIQVAIPGKVWERGVTDEGWVCPEGWRDALCQRMGAGTRRIVFLTPVELDAAIRLSDGWVRGASNEFDRKPVLETSWRLRVARDQHEGRA